MEFKITIRNEEDWKRHFPPAGGDKQWREGYSALEFAKIVTNRAFEKDLANSLKFDNSFHLKSGELYPERLSKFDNNPRGPRHHDLACVAEYHNKEIALCFEAKVNESLDKQLSKYRDSDGKKERVDLMIANFLNGRKYSDKEFGHIYYQIFSAIAGSIAFAAERNIVAGHHILTDFASEI